MYSYIHLYHVYTDNINNVENIVQVNFMAAHYITKFELNITTKLVIAINYKQTINTVSLNLQLLSTIHRHWNRVAGGAIAPPLFTQQSCLSKNILGRDSHVKLQYNALLSQ